MNTASNTIHIRSMFNDTFTSESDPIFRFCLISLSDRENALKIVRETFERFLRELQGGEEVNNSRSYLFAVAHRLIMTRRRSRAPEKAKLTKDASSADAEKIKGLVFEAEGRNLIDSILKLDQSSRQAVYLRYVESLSLREIGQVFGVSPHDASARITGGLNGLRKLTKQA